MERVQDFPIDRIDKCLPNPILQDCNSFINTIGWVELTTEVIT